MKHRRRLKHRNEVLLLPPQQLVQSPLPCRADGPRLLNLTWGEGRVEIERCGAGRLGCELGDVQRGGGPLGGADQSCERVG